MPSHITRNGVHGKHASIPLDDSLKRSNHDEEPAHSRQNAHSTEDSAAYQLEVRQPSSHHTVRYLNGDALNRPIELPHREHKMMFIIMCIAAILAAAFLFLYFDNTANAPAREQEVVADMLNEDVPLDLPDLLSLVTLSDEQLDAKLKEGGATLFEKSPAGSGTPYEVIKLPEGVSLVEATDLYLTGINRLSASQATLLLNGSWDFAVDRKNGINMSLHYADFQSGDVRAAIDNAIKTENLERDGKGDSGEDDGYGNAYSTGQVVVENAPYTWTVSAIPLKQVYSLHGLPDDAVYVGIRIKNI